MADNQEKKVETLEGGDKESDTSDASYAEIQSQMTKRHSQDDISHESVDKPPEDYKIEGGDTEWESDQEGVDSDYAEDEEDTEEKEEKEEKEVSPDGESEEKSETSEADEKIKEDIIKYLDAEGGTKYIVKGKEYDLRDLSAKEIRDRFSKAGRFYERMQELASKEKTIDERERVAEDGARRAQEIMHRYGDKADTAKVKLPDVLTPHEDDEPEMRAIKELNASMYQELKSLKSGYEEQGRTMAEQNLYRDLDALHKEFPMMSREEVVAVKAYYPESDIRTVAENSHNNRVSDEYIDSVFEARPERLREIEEKAVEKYLAKKPGVKKVARKKSSTTVSSKSSSANKKVPHTFDEIEAELDRQRVGNAFDED